MEITSGVKADASAKQVPHMFVIFVHALVTFLSVHKPSQNTTVVVQPLSSQTTI
jgi:hypothetical protein